METLTLLGTSTGCHSWQTAASLATCLESRQAEARGGWQLTVEMSVAYPLTHPDRHCKGQTVNRASPSNSNDAKQQAKGVWCHRPSPEVEVEGSESQGHSQPLSMFEASLGYKNAAREISDATRQDSSLQNILVQHHPESLQLPFR